MNKIFKLYIPLIIVVASLLLSSLAFTKAPTNRRSLAKATALETEVVDGNRIYNYINNRGAWCTHNNPVGFGMQWPGQSGHSVNFASGVWMAGTVGGQIRTACAEFAYEFQPGPIINGVAVSPDDPRFEIAKINKGDLLDEGFTNPDYGRWVDDYYQFGAPVLKAADGSDSLSASGRRIPAMVGDQMLWMVMNDLDVGAHSLFGTSPIGLEVQTLVWVYNRPDAFGDMMFMKFLLVNKGQNPLQDAYIGLWFDIDLGDSNDDIVFCDTTLSLGAFWNDGDDVEFPIPPAVGADFFQGPIVASVGDTANVSGVKFPGYKNLPMTSFVKYVRGGPADQQDPETAQQAYNFMRGLNGLGQPIIDPISNQATQFVNISDPETGTGWIDGNTDLPADRRMLQNTGPFTMEVWVDTNGDGIAQAGEPGVQEVVAGFMIAQGTDAKNSATRLKQVDALAQLAYDLNFALPPSPANPAVEVHQLDGEIILTWGGEVENYQAIDRVDVDEEGNPTYYVFQGYNVYQTNSPVVGPNSRVLKLATYDIADGVGDIKDNVFSEEFGENVEATVQRAPDTGVQRMYRATTDPLRGGRPLSNWNPYWYIVTAYGYNPHGIPKILESPLTTIEAVPQPPPEGLQTTANFRDLIAAATPDTTFNATHTSTGALSEGQLQVIVINPSKITGKDYEVTFEQDATTSSISWNLDRLDVGGKTRVLAKQTNQTGDDGYMVVDGLMIKIIGPVPGMKGWNIPSGTRRFSPVLGFAGLGLEGFSTSTQTVSYDVENGTIGMAGNFAFGGIQTSLGVSEYRNVLLKLAAVDNVNLWDPKATPTDPNFSKAYRWLRAVGATSTPADPSFEPWIINKGSGYPYQDYDYGVPFSAWNMETDPPTRLSVGMFENNVVGGLIDGRYWPRHASDPDYDNSVTREFCFIFNVPYSETPDPSLQINLFSSTTPMMWVMVCSRRAEVPWASGDEFLIMANHVNMPADLFTFKTNSVTPITSAALAKEAAQLVNIFPNPYFGQNRGEINPVERFVTLSHLPTSGATIRIFTLAGSLVKTIDDDVRSEQGTLGTHSAQWNLRNDDDVPVASGLYILHVDMGSLGEKVLKAVVFMPEERLDKF